MAAEFRSVKQMTAYCHHCIGIKWFLVLKIMMKITKVPNLRPKKEEKIFIASLEASLLYSQDLIRRHDKVSSFWKGNIIINYQLYCKTHMRESLCRDIVKIWWLIFANIIRMYISSRNILVARPWFTLYWSLNGMSRRQFLFLSSARCQFNE